MGASRASRSVGRLGHMKQLFLLVVALSALGSASAAAAQEAEELSDLSRRLRSCEAVAHVDRSTIPDEPMGRACGGVIYVWSPLMPLSRRGIQEIHSATEDLGISLTVVEASSIYEHAETVAGETVAGKAGGPSTDALVESLIARGATTHFPAVILHRGGDLLGGAILGFKTADTYRRMIEGRMGDGTVREVTDEPSPELTLARSRDVGQAFTDLPVDGNPGAYFRWVPGTRVIAYEMRGRIYLLDLRTRVSSLAPGSVDFIPTPDGRLFVTPGPRRSGLQFFDAAEVLEAARRGRAREVRPLYVDPAMTDQYPSVGILDRSDGGDRSVTTYRIMVSWYDRVVYRDYELTLPDWGLRPRGEVVPACPGLQVSLPMISKDGSEIAGRDETTATTKLFRMSDDGRCDEVLDLGIQTGKIAFDQSGRRAAFAVPRGAAPNAPGRGLPGLDVTGSGELSGIFVLDREGRRISRVQGSEDASRLAFPDFVGADSIIFLLPRLGDGEPSRFRLVCCIR